MSVIEKIVSLMHDNSNELGLSCI